MSETTETIENRGPPTPPHEDTTEVKPVSEAERKKALRADAAARLEILSDSNANVQDQVRALFYSLIYWDKPAHSGLALVGSLALLVLTSYFSPLRLISGFWTLAILGNLLYVHSTFQYKRLTGKDVTNPHEVRMKTTEGGLVTRDTFDHYVGVAVDAINLATHEGAKIVLIEDTPRSLSWLLWSVLTYLATGWLSTKWIISTGIVFVFSLPKLYIENKPLVDEHVTKATVIAREQGAKAQALAKQHAGPYYDKGIALGQQYNIIPKSKNE